MTVSGWNKARSIEELYDVDVVLTERQLEVLSGVARGLTDVEIGGELGISANTVHNHLAQMREITGAHTRAALVVHALFGFIPGCKDMDWLLGITGVACPSKLVRLGREVL